MSPTSQFKLNNDTRNWISFNVTPDIRAFLADTVNRGWYVTKQNNNNNNERIVFWSRESSLSPHLVLFTRADSNFTLTSVVEEGVTGSPSTGASQHQAGSNVSYSFSPASGYTNLLVTLDGTIVPASGSIPMSGDHTLIVSADQIVTVSSSDQLLVTQFRGVLTSPDPVASYQAAIDQAVALVESTTPEDAELRLAKISYLAFDPIADSSALRQVDGALANHVFQVSGPENTDSTHEATTFLFINGVRNEYTSDALGGVSMVKRLIGTSHLFSDTAQSPVELYYNRNYSTEQQESSQDKYQRCLATVSLRTRFAGAQQSLQLFTQCMFHTSSDFLLDQDIVEAVVQFFSVQGSPDVDIDAQILADTLQLKRQAGRHVIMIPHSQGALMAQQAIRDLRNTYNYSEQHDSTCVGAVALAPPLSSDWDLPEGRLTGFVLEHDLVADWPWNDFPRITNSVSEAMGARIDSLPAPGNIMLNAYLTWNYVLARLKVHELASYAIPTETRDIVVDSLESLYHDCTASTIHLSLTNTMLRSGSTVQLFGTILNMHTDTLRGRRIRWSTSNAAAATVDSNGVVRAVGEGSATITARNAAATATASILAYVTSPFPNKWVFDTWTRTVEVAGTSCDDTLIIDVGARLSRDCHNGSPTITQFNTSESSPWVQTLMAPVGGTSERWHMSLTGDGDTLEGYFTRTPSDPAPATIQSFRRQGSLGT